MSESASSPKPHPSKHLLIRIGITALTRMVLLIEHLRTLDPKPQTGYIVVSNGDVPPLLTDLCNSYAEAANILFDSVPKRENESRKYYEARSDRVGVVAKACQGINLSPLTDRTMRNRVAHVDEHFTKLSLKHPTASWMINIGFSGRAAIAPGPGVTLLYCRSYIFDEEKMLHMETELDVGAMHAAGVQILERLTGPNWREVPQ